MTALPAAQVVPELRETLLTQFSTQLLTAKRFAEIVQLWRTPFAKSEPLTASQHFVLGLALLEVKERMAEGRRTLAPMPRHPRATRAFAHQPGDSQGRAEPLPGAGARGLEAER